jgi:hypothetical protein
MADIGDHAWVVVLAYAATQSGDPLIAERFRGRFSIWPAAPLPTGSRPGP